MPGGSTIGIAAFGVAWVAGLILLGAPGLTLLILGLRGRRIDDHPYCRKCRFDLTGKSAERDHCPECGADLTAPKATRIGLRRRRPGAIVAGAILLLVALAPAGLAIWASTSRNSIQPYLPLWALRWETHLGEPTTSTALNEVLNRLQARTPLPQSTLNGLLDDALIAQANPNQPWNTRWGDVFETAQAQGLVDPTRLATYARQAVSGSVSLEVRPKIATGDPIPYRLVEKSARVGSSHQQNLWHELHCGKILIGAMAVKSPGGGSGSSLSSTGSGWTGSSLTLTDKEWSQIAQGPVQITIEAQSKVFATSNHTGPPIVQWATVLYGGFEVVPRGQGTGKTVTDPVLKAAVEAAIAPQDFRTLYGLQGQFEIKSPPTGLAFAVYVLVGGQRTRLGSISQRAGGSTSYSTGGSADVHGATKVDVILEPDSAVALDTTDVMDYWGEPITFHDVPVRQANTTVVPTSPTPAAGSPAGVAASRPIRP